MMTLMMKSCATNSNVNNHISFNNIFSTVTIFSIDWHFRILNCSKFDHFSVAIELSYSKLPYSPWVLRHMLFQSFPWDTRMRPSPCFQAWVTGAEALRASSLLLVGEDKLSIWKSAGKAESKTWKKRSCEIIQNSSPCGTRIFTAPRIRTGWPPSAYPDRSSREETERT